VFSNLVPNVLQNLNDETVCDEPEVGVGRTRTGDADCACNARADSEHEDDHHPGEPFLPEVAPLLLLLLVGHWVLDIAAIVVTAQGLLPGVFVDVPNLLVPVHGAFVLLNKHRALYDQEDDLHD